MFDEKFWVGVSFAIFVALIYKPLSRILTKGLDSRSQKIQEELERAVQLREEAQAIFASYQRKQQEAIEEAGAIMSQAKISAGYMIEKARQDLEETLNRRVEAAMQKISLHEVGVLQELRQSTVELALKAVRQVVIEDIDKEPIETVHKSVEEIRKKFH